MRECEREKDKRTRKKKEVEEDTVDIRREKERLMKRERKMEI